MAQKIWEVIELPRQRKEAEENVWLQESLRLTPEEGLLVQEYETIVKGEIPDPPSPEERTAPPQHVSKRVICLKKSEWEQWVERNASVVTKVSQKGAWSQWSSSTMGVEPTPRPLNNGFTAIWYDGEKGVESVFKELNRAEMKAIQDPQGPSKEVLLEKVNVHDFGNRFWEWERRVKAAKSPRWQNPEKWFEKVVPNAWEGEEGEDDLAWGNMCCWVNLGDQSQWEPLVSSLGERNMVMIIEPDAEKKGEDPKIAVQWSQDPMEPSLEHWSALLKRNPGSLKMWVNAKATEIVLKIDQSKQGERGDESAEKAIVKKSFRRRVFWAPSKAQLQAERNRGGALLEQQMEDALDVWRKMGKGLEERPRFGAMCELMDRFWVYGEFPLNNPELLKTAIIDTAQNPQSKERTEALESVLHWVDSVQLQWGMDNTEAVESQEQKVQAPDRRTARKL